MSLISSTIPNLINGVSQQPYALRLASQCELQENCNSSVVSGLRPRGGTRHRARILETPLDNAFTHLINRDTTERYRVIIEDGAIRVFDLAGVQQTMSYEGAAADYLVSSTPAEDFTAMTVADHTFILNKKTVTDDDETDTSPTGWPHEALIWIRQGAPSTKYVINIDGFHAERKTGTAEVVPDSVGTDNIAAALCGNTGVTDAIGLQYVLGASGGTYTYTNFGSLIYIRKTDGTDFSINVSDGLGDTGMVLIKGATQRFTNLPARGYPGFRCEVRGEGSGFAGSYWVEFVSDASNPFGGVWKECVKPGEVRAIDPATMPHLLVRNGDGTFTFKAAEWGKRKVGDIESNPFPSFMGRRLNDVFLHRNRLGVLSDEGMIMTRAGEFFNFFRDSAIQVLDTDPIDIAVSHTKVSILNHAVPFNESLLLFSDQTQFILGHTSDVLTVKSASIDQTTEFECLSSVKPIGAGNNVYFVQNRGQHCAVREFTVDADTQTKDAQDITSHVPKYIPQGVFKLSASSTESVIIALTHAAPSSMFVYQYHLANGSKLQSAWHEWKFAAGDTILNADFIEGDLHLLINRDDGVYLETMSVTAGVSDGGMEFSAHLDRQVDETQVISLIYSISSQTSSFTLPYTPDGPASDYELVAWSDNEVLKPGTKMKFVLSGPNVGLVSKGNLTSFRFGRKIKSRYVFSRFQLREQSPGGGQTPVGEGRLNVRRMSLSHGESGYFRVEVTPRGREKYVYTMTGRRIGSSASLIGEVALIDGVFRLPVMARNIDVTIELTSDEFLPYSILSADWEGLYVIRSRRM